MNLTNLCTLCAINLLGKMPNFYAKIRKFLRKKNFFGGDGGGNGAEMGMNGAKWGWGEEEGDGDGTGGWGEVGMDGF